MCRAYVHMKCVCVKHVHVMCIVSGYVNVCVYGVEAADPRVTHMSEGVMLV